MGMTAAESAGLVELVGCGGLKPTLQLTLQPAPQPTLRIRLTKHPAP
ncbi:hypothetical protein NEILACOT_05159 [Neisseria lactamica ATCC 23970]|uniref:Uncharacterized protein n=1 Tax=Neisseria lactamica ATCC 23970 TaxID=546265 RepID=D0WC79_NEILA|nr:hypothetical protein NEILACOT_05159 [Neisseria lactamica ATCC 23970]